MYSSVVPAQIYCVSDHYVSDHHCHDNNITWFNNDGLKHHQMCFRPSGLERRFYNGHNCKVDGSTPTGRSRVVASLDKTLHDNFLCVVES